MNEKGIVRIKLLTIILVVCIICFTLVPYLFNLYSNNLKEKYISVAKHYISEVKDSINSLEYKQLPSVNEALLIKLSDIDLKLNSPYGAFKDEYSYVVVLNMGEYFDYYFASVDSANWGIPVVEEKELNIDSIVYGNSKLSNIDKVSSIDDLYIAGTIFERSENTKKNDKNTLLVPVSGDLTVPYEFKKDVHKIYDDILKNVDTDIYNKEVTINNGIIKYNNEKIGNDYSNDVNGFFRYISFPDKGKELYYSSFVSYNKSYVAGMINESSDYTTNSIVFDSMPTIVMNKDAKIVQDNNQKYLMWNLMAIYPDNSNYMITECGALILKDNSSDKIDITFDTEGVLIGKSNNSCELGNIFAIRKDNINENDKFFARGYIKYVDINGEEFISYSNSTVNLLVK